jgi:hypothetical protein
MQGGCYAVCPRHLGAVPRELIRPKLDEQDGIADAELVLQPDEPTAAKLHPLEPERKEGRIIDGGTPSAAFQTELGCFFESAPAVSANGQCYTTIVHMFITRIWMLRHCSTRIVQVWRVTLTQHYG